MISMQAMPQVQKINEKAAKAYEDALLQLRDGFVKDAIPLLEKIMKSVYRIMKKQGPLILLISSTITFLTLLILQG
jgi:hypothetical protein